MGKEAIFKFLSIFGEILYSRLLVMNISWRNFT